MMFCWQVEVSKEFGIPVESQRFWVWAKRQNNTYRPSRPLDLQEEKTAVSGMPILDVMLVFDAVRILFKLFSSKEHVG
jgi:ubiquitin carboxyl-terminal hydrolase 7